MAGKISVLTMDELRAVMREVEEMIDILYNARPHVRPVVLGFLGAGLIHACCKATDGDPKWWADLVAADEDMASFLKRNMVKPVPE